MNEKKTLKIVKALLVDGEDPAEILNDCTQAMGTIGKHFAMEGVNLAKERTVME